jgi:hypothetical protein
VDLLGTFRAAWDLSVPIRSVFTDGAAQPDAWEALILRAFPACIGALRFCATDARWTHGARPDVLVEGMPVLYLNVQVRAARLILGLPATQVSRGSPRLRPTGLQALY